ncbi:proliferation-associated protein, metalloprotease family M24X, partial [Thraustotheca clavata]
DHDAAEIQAPIVEDCSNSDVVTKYRLAAEIAQSALDGVIAQLAPGKSVVELCAFGDAIIAARAGTVYKNKKVEKGIAFPTCISVNEIVCHFSPLPSEGIEIKAGDWVKIDLGCHIDGYIAVVAHTVIVPEKEGDDLIVIGGQADVLKCAQDAIELCARLIKPGNTNHQVTEALEKLAESYGVKSLHGTLMHQMKRFVIDGTKTIAQKHDPEAKTAKVTFEANEVYAIDVAFTTGLDKPVASERRTTVFKRQVDKSYRLKMKASRYVFSEINSKFPTLPFTIRAFADEAQSRMGVVECVKHDLLTPFPILEGREGDHIAHLKATVLLMPNGTAKITGLSLPLERINSDKVVSPEIAAILSSSLKKKSKKKKSKSASAAKEEIQQDILIGSKCLHLFSRNFAVELIASFRYKEVESSVFLVLSTKHKMSQSNAGIVFTGPFYRLKAMEKPPYCLYCTSASTSNDALSCSLCGREKQVPWLCRSKLQIDLGTRIMLRTPLTTYLGVVTAVDVLRRTIEIFYGAQMHPVQWKIQIIPLQMLSIIEPLPLESPWHSILDCHGLCPECRLPFRMANMSPNFYDSHESKIRAAVAMKERLKFHQSQLQTLNDCKLQAKSVHASSRTLVELTAKIRQEQFKIHGIQKQLEPIQEWCPHCGHTHLFPIYWLCYQCIITTNKKQMKILMLISIFISTNNDYFNAAFMIDGFTVNQPRKMMLLRPKLLSRCILHRSFTSAVNNSSLVNPEWVLDNASNVRVVDCGSPDAYTRGHVPGAKLFPMPTKDQQDPRKMIPEAYFHACLKHLDVGTDTTLVFYDDQFSLNATRAWWILDGGWQYWVKNDYEVAIDDKATAPPTSSTLPSLEPEKKLSIDLAEMNRIVDDAKSLYQIIDTRSIEEFTGVAAHGNARPGHVPRAIHWEWRDTIDSSTGKFKSPGELRAVADKLGLVADKPVVTYCQRAIRGAHMAFVLDALLGFKDVRVYEGSMLEYLNDPNTNVATN